MKRKITTLLLACACLVSSFCMTGTTVHAANTETNTLSNDDITEGNINKNDCIVSVNVGSTFTVTLPKKITLAGNSGKCDYDVTIKGNIGARQRVSIIPDESFNLSSTGKTDVETSVTQAKTVFSYDELAVIDNQTSNVIGTTIQGSVESGELSAGKWSGVFNFHIDTYEFSQIGVTAINKDNNEDLNATAYTIEGKEKEDLLEALVDANVSSEVTSVDDVDALIEVNSDDFDNLSETTFDVSTIAGEGDRVVILHYDEEKGEWEYIGTDTVEDGKVTADFSSYSPVAFVVVKDDGSLHSHKYELESDTSTCTEDGVKTYKCECDDVKTETATAKGHVDEDTDNICDVCDTELTIPIDVPTQTGTLRWTGGELTPQWSVYDSEKMTISGTTSAINEGTHVAIFTPKANYVWKDGTKGPKEVQWVISEPAYFITDGNGTITGLTEKGKTKTTLTIPKDIDGETIKGIGDGAFENCTSLTDVSITSGVNIIGKQAFKGCTSLQTIEIPYTVNKIGRDAFAGTVWLATEREEDPLVAVNGLLIDGQTATGEIYINKQYISTIVEGAFENNNNITTIIILSTLELIEAGAFDGCTSLVTVKYTGTEEMWNTSSWDNHTTVYDEVILNSNIIFCYTPPEWFEVDSYEYSIDYDPSAITGITNHQSALNDSLRNITIPEEINGVKIKKICDYAFSDLGLESVKLPNTLESIGMSAFSSSSFESIIIPDSVQYIGAGAFSSCNLKTIVLPRYINRIEDEAFYDCYNIETVYYKGSKSEWEDLLRNNVGEFSNDAIRYANVVYNYTGN